MVAALPQRPTALTAFFVVGRAWAVVPAPHEQRFAEILADGRQHVDNFTNADRGAFLSQLVASFKIRRALGGADLDVELGRASSGDTLSGRVRAREVRAGRVGIVCPPNGAGVGQWSAELEVHHYARHRGWSIHADFCNATGLWTKGCGVMCPLRAAVIGDAVSLGPGQRVLDVGSGCGHFAQWFYDWFGASTFGVDFVKEAVDFSNARISPKAPARFCWLDIGTFGLGFLPAGNFDLAMAVSVLQYLRTDEGLHEKNPTAKLTPCGGLPATKGTQCSVAREMFQAVRVGGHVWICHNGSYKGKWDPRLVWGDDYWRCCFADEIAKRAVKLLELPELELFLYSSSWDPTYSVVLRRLMPDSRQDRQTRLPH